VTSSCFHTEDLHILTATKFSHSGDLATGICAPLLQFVEIHVSCAVYGTLVLNQLLRHYDCYTITAVPRLIAAIATAATNAQLLMLDSNDRLNSVTRTEFCGLTAKKGRARSTGISRA
jgi:hypothetical protein